MEVQFGPNAVDEPNLLYKLQRKIQVFSTTDPLPNRGYNLVTNSSKYGLVFIAVPDGTLTVYQLNQLVDKECDPQHLTVKLQEKPTHISVSCDHELLAVSGGQYLSVYKVVDFQNPNVSPSYSIRTEVSPSTFVSALQWNPCIPDSIAIAFYDGTLMACLVNSGQVKKVPSKARCICWSPKGKQLVTGNSDGTLIQYKPELTAAKLVQAPNLFEGSPVEALAIYWVSTFQFAVVYKNATDNSRPAVTMINTPKAGQPSCINYEDICYSMGSNRPWYYYLLGLAQWNIIMASSSNSMEIATLGIPDTGSWVQWCQNDEARPELPLTDKKIENYPVGLSIDTCAIHQLPWGESGTLPFMPLLHVVSQNGLLTTFNVIEMSGTVAQVCSPPQLLALPAQALTSVIPGVTATAPPPVPTSTQKAPIPQPEAPPIYQVPQTVIAQPSPPQPSVPASATIKIPSFTPQAHPSFGVPLNNQAPEQSPAAETTAKPVATSQIPVNVTQTQQQNAVAKQLAAAEAAARQAEQEKAHKEKANQELKDMLVKEVNDFQMELYNFMVKTRETQVRLQRDIDTISTNFKGLSLNTEDLKKECSMNELRESVVQLKLELVRACAVVAEARAHSDAKDLHQWSQADPLTTKRVASVKKLAYYVQTQLAQAHAALDYKWNEVASHGSQTNRPVKRMIRPVLDDVYQPLVKQQEILSRQEAVLRTLQDALEQCDIGPVFKSSSLLRSTPLKNKDPLSKLTKNILNMSLETETKPKKPILSAQKLDALRDVLSNHKTAKIKPVNVELRQHLETLRKNYETSVKVKAEKVQSMPTSQTKVVPKAEPVAEITATSFTPVASQKPVPVATNVVRTLFTNEPKQEIPRPVSKPFEYPAPTATVVPTATNTKSVLKDVLTNKQANLEAKNNSNMFMGQKICSPTAFGQQSVPTPSAPSAVFTSKPIADLNNMFNKFQPQPFLPESKSNLNTKQNIPTSVSNVNSSETGEPENTQAPKPKPMTNLFGMKPTVPTNIPAPVSTKTPISSNTTLTAPTKTPIATSTPLTGPAISIQQKQITVKPVEKLTTKENVPEQDSENAPKTVQKPVEKKETAKPLASQTSNKGLTFGVLPSSDAASSVTASKPQSAFATPPTSIKTEPLTPTESEPPSPSSASSIFGAAVASQPKTTTSIFSSTSSVFSSTPTTSSIFGTSTTPAFGSTTTAAKSSAASSIFKSAIPQQTNAQSPTPVSETTTAVASVFGSSSVSITPVLGSSSAPTVFGKAVTTTTASVFGSTSTTAASPTTTASVFGSKTSSVTLTGTTSSIFGSTTPCVTPTSTVASVFGSTSPTVAPVSSTASVFGSTSPSAASPVTTASIFGATSPSITSSTTAASVFGSTSPSISSPTTTASVFGSTTASVFSATTTASTASVFGSPSQTSVYAPKEASPSAFTPTTTTSLFGATTQASSVFSQAAQSVFGTTTQASIFGATTTQASVFGSPTTQTSVFGTPTATTQASVFGSPTQTTQTSIFGTPTATTQASVFGTPPQGSPSVFGTPTQPTQASVFGTPTQTTQASVFGTPTQTTQASIFGQPAAAQSGGSLFGGAECNLFAAASISTTSAPTAGSGGNIFGGSSGSVFGGGSGGGNVFGGKSTFGQPNPAAASIFGGGGSFGQKQPNQPTNIWGSGTTGSSGFGSSAFGQSATTQPSSIFGGTTGGSFSQPSGGAFSSPPQQTGFGSPTQQQTSAFGGGTVFGSKPLFGQPTGFGSPASSGFGSPAAFGGFNKSPGGGSAFGSPAFGGASAFGGGSPGGGFAAATQSNATFENLATQNTLTFGNLAQQSPGSPQPAAPSFNTSPSFTGWRG